MKKSIILALVAVFMVLSFSACGLKKIGGDVKAVADRLKQADVVPDLSTIIPSDAIEAQSSSYKADILPVFWASATEVSYEVVNNGSYNVIQRERSGIHPTIEALQNSVEIMALSAKNMINNDAPNVPVLNQWVKSEDYFYTCKAWYFRLDKEENRITYSSYIDMQYGGYPEGFFDFYRISVTNSGDKEIIEYQEIFHDNREGNDTGLNVIAISFYYIEGEEFYYSSQRIDRLPNSKSTGKVIGLKKSEVNGNEVVDLAQISFSEGDTKYVDVPDDKKQQSSIYVSNIVSGNDNLGYFSNDIGWKRFYINGKTMFGNASNDGKENEITVSPEYLNENYTNFRIMSPQLTFNEGYPVNISAGSIRSYRFIGEEKPDNDQSICPYEPVIYIDKEEINDHIIDSVKDYAQRFLQMISNEKDITLRVFPVWEQTNNKSAEEAYDLILDYIFEEKFKNLCTIEQAKALPQNFANAIDRSQYESSPIYDLARFDIRSRIEGKKIIYSTSVPEELQGDNYRLVAGFYDILNDTEHPMLIVENPKHDVSRGFEFYGDYDETIKKYFELSDGFYASCVWYQKKDGNQWVTCTPYVENIALFEGVISNGSEWRWIANSKELSKGAVEVITYDLAEEFYTYR